MRTHKIAQLVKVTVVNYIIGTCWILIYCCFCLWCTKLYSSKSV